jgi:hypothetical protein
MPTKYPPEAVETCRKFFCEFGGNAQEVEKAMRKQYPSWAKQLLYDKGTEGKNARLGWITKYGFEKSLQLHLQTQISAVESDDERRYRAVVQLADHYQQLALQGDEKAVPMFIKLTDQQIELRSKLDLTTANFETFATDFDLIVKWAKEIDTELAKLFYRYKDKFIGKAESHFGKND